MLRREADGVAWYTARRRQRNAADPSPSLVLTFVARVGHEDAVSITRRLEAALRSSFATVGAVTERYPTTVYHRGHPSPPRFGVEPDDGGFEAALGLFQDPDSHRMTMVWGVDQEPERAPGFSPNVLVEASAVVGGPGLWQWQTVATIDQDAAPSTDDLADCWAEVLRDLGGSFGVVWGAVYYDRWQIGSTPYERYFTITTGAKTAEEHPRGYYWCNLLSAAHIQALGGLEAIRSACAASGLDADPVEREGAVTGVLVRVRAPVTHLADEALGAVRDLVRPALDPRPYWWYAGPALRVFKEPGTAYKPIPADIIEPRFDDDPPPGPDSGTASRLVPDV